MGGIWEVDMSTRGIVLGWCILGFAFTASGQQQGGAANAGTAAPASGAGGNVPRGDSSGRSNPANDPGALSQRPIFLSGKVMLTDGAAFTTQIKIERVCNGNAHVEGYVDSRGNFSIELGRNMGFQDASIHSDPVSGGTMRDPMRPGGGYQDPFGGGGSRITERDLFGCGVRASLNGYRSDEISLAGRRALDNPDVGTIVLRPYSKSEGQFVSATSALAPKDAKKAYSKALDALKKRNPDEAQANLEKATTIYPKYAAAWFEMGKLLEQQKLPAEARRAYSQALTADSKFLPPYERLSIIAMRESKWQEVADASDKLLGLDPSTYPNVYYMSSVAHLELQHFDVAEKKAREAIRLDPAKKNMQSYYILGLAQASQGNFQESMAAIKTFLATPPAGANVELVRKQLSQMEEAAQQKVAGAQQ